MGKKYNLLGQTFGDWRVIESSGHNSYGGLLWLCECACGARKIHSTSTLCAGVTKRCRKCFSTPTNKYNRNGDAVTVFCSNGKPFIVDFADLKLVRQYQWFQAGNDGYITAKTGQKKISLHRLLMDASVRDLVDHISGDIFDNRRSNLRLCNKQQNKRNEKIRKDNKTGYKGVTWHRECKKYMYKLKGGYKVRERQIFLRTFSVTNDSELHTAKYFVNRDKVYYIDADTGAARRCNFNASFLSRGYSHTFQPLDEFYEGAVDGDETEDEADEITE